MSHARTGARSSRSAHCERAAMALLIRAMLQCDRALNACVNTHAHMCMRRTCAPAAHYHLYESTSTIAHTLGSGAQAIGARLRCGLLLALIETRRRRAFDLQRVLFLHACRVRSSGSTHATKELCIRPEDARGAGARARTWPHTPLELLFIRRL